MSILPFRSLWANNKILDNKYLVRKYSTQNRDVAGLIKNSEFQDIITESRRIAPLVSEILRTIRGQISNEKMTKLQLQNYVVDRLEEYNLIPSMAGYHGFPAAIAISIDSELIHNIPDKTAILPSSIITVEIGASSNVAYASQTWSFLVPQADPKKSNLFAAAKLALNEALKQVRDGSHLGNIGHSIQTTIEGKGYSVVREFCGYGMGNSRIIEPQILGYGNKNTGSKIKTGQILNIYILANEGKQSVILDTDNWGVKTKDGSDSAAISAMVLVKPDGYELLSDIDL